VIGTTAFIPGYYNCGIATCGDGVTVYPEECDGADSGNCSPEEECRDCRCEYKCIEEGGTFNATTDPGKQCCSGLQGIYANMTYNPATHQCQSMDTQWLACRKIDGVCDQSKGEWFCTASTDCQNVCNDGYVGSGEGCDPLAPPE
jgi:hypothetical protein